MKFAFLFAMILSVPLEAPFASAEATATRVDGDMMWIDVRVETVRTADVVLARAVGPDNRPLDPVAMEADGAIWSTTLFLPRRSDIRLAFEHLDAEGFSFVSRPAALIELGVDAALFSLGDPPASPPEPVDSGGGDVRWLWLAGGLAAGALALVLVAFTWVKTDSGSETAAG